MHTMPLYCYQRTMLHIQLYSVDQSQEPVAVSTNHKSRLRSEPYLEVALYTHRGHVGLVENEEPIVGGALAVWGMQVEDSI